MCVCIYIHIYIMASIRETSITSENPQLLFLSVYMDENLSKIEADVA